MAALNIRDLGTDRKAALEAEAQAQGVSVSELVRRLIDQGIAASISERERREWLEAAREGLAFEAETLNRDGPSLARHRVVRSRSGE